MSAKLDWDLWCLDTIYCKWPCDLYLLGFVCCKLWCTGCSGVVLLWPGLTVCATLIFLWDETGWAGFWTCWVGKALSVHDAEGTFRDTRLVGYSHGFGICPPL